jgi:hypothetical protein
MTTTTLKAEYLRRRTKLIAAYRASNSTLLAQGFERVCAALAGPDSEFRYAHPDGRRAKVRVATGNQIEFLP